VAHVLNLYRIHRILVRKRTIAWVSMAVLLTFFALMLVGIVFKTTEGYPCVRIFSWFATTTISVVALRAVLLAIIEAKVTRGACLQRAFLVAFGSSNLSGGQLALETRNRVRLR
jgi:hypothetical protein